LEGFRYKCLYPSIVLRTGFRQFLAQEKVPNTREDWGFSY